MEVTVEHLGASQFEIKARQHTVLSDQPAELKDPARVDNCHIQIEAPAELTAQHRAGVENAVHHCLIHNTLLHPPAIVIEISNSVAADVRLAK
jgi:hypothetical protein